MLRVRLPLPVPLRVRFALARAIAWNSPTGRRRGAESAESAGSNPASRTISKTHAYVGVRLDGFSRSAPSLSGTTCGGQVVRVS